MKMGKLLLGKIFVIVAVIAMPLVLTACGPTLLAFEPPAATLSSIVLRTDSTKIKTAYMSGEFFVPTGLTVEAVYTDRTRKEIALEDVDYNKTPLTMNDTTITFSYAEGTGNNAIIRSADLKIDVTVMAGGQGFSDKVWWSAQDDGPVYRENILWGYKGAMSPNYTLDIIPGTRVIAENAFYYYANLTAVTIPDSVFYIGSGAFRDTGVTKFEIPDSVEFLGNRALSSAVHNTISVGTGVTHDLEKAFDRTKTTRLDVAYNNDSYTTVGYDMLFNKNCTTLVTVLTNINGIITLSGTITEIAAGAFYNCEAITHIVLPVTLEKIGTIAFANCTGIISISIPASVREISALAFDGCKKLTMVYLANDSDTATVMGHGIFGGCTALKTIEIYDKVIPSITADVFPQHKFNIEIHTANNVASRVAAVKAMPGWSVHADKITEVR